MLESRDSLDVETIVDRARSLWREATTSQLESRVELFAKVSHRIRVVRDPYGIDATVDRVHESGIAVRIFRPTRDRAGFAAASGLTAEAVRWAVASASDPGAEAGVAAPGPADSVAPERWDLDVVTPVLGEERLTLGLDARPSLQWVEAGTTVEVLIGAEGWFAARRRHRLWALDLGSGVRLVAQRGFANWEELLHLPLVDNETPLPRSPAGRGCLLLAPDAASPVVAALVDAFHGPQSTPTTGAGSGWDVTEDPLRPDGLAGGSFDDAGFPATSRVLTTHGIWVDKLGGPGTFWRASFREPPKESSTNLVMTSADPLTIPDAARVVRRCRVLRQSSDLWVLELDLQRGGSTENGERRWVRARPHALLAACSACLGGSRVTSNGVIVPWLRLEPL